MSEIIDIYNYIDSIAPFSLQEEWDNSGFLIGDAKKNVDKVLVALDCTGETILEAERLGCQLIVTHHPVIFRAQKNLFSDNVAYMAANKNIAVISTHTSYDCADGGVGDILAQTLGLENIQKSSKAEFRFGNCKKTTVKEFAEFVKKRLNAEVCYCNGDKEAETVAVCGGAGSDFLCEAKVLGADLLVTGEGSHHDFIDAASMNMGLITAGHFETEVIAMKPLADKLQNHFNDVSFIMAQQSSPIKHI